MGKFIMVLVLAVGVVLGGYYMFGDDDQDAPDDDGDRPTQHQDDDVPFGEDGDGEDPADPGELDPELAELLEKTDAAWEEIAAADGNPAIHERTVALARAYSRVLRGTYNKPGYAELQQRLVARLTPVGEHLFFEPTQYHGEETGLIRYHQIGQGELFPSIGRKYGLSEEHINLMRGKEPKNEQYRAGERIKVVDTLGNGGFLLHIDKSDFYMDLFVGGVFCKRFPIGHGKPGYETPTGETVIIERLASPAWTNPEDNKVYHKGDPGYIIGDYWLGFREYGGRAGLGIHGYTGEGKAIGAKVSSGCIRMRNEDAELLFNVLVPVGTYPKIGFKSRAPMKVEIVE